MMRVTSTTISFRICRPALKPPRYSKRQMPSIPLPQKVNSVSSSGAQIMLTACGSDTSTVIFGSPSPDPFDEPQEVERITPAAFEAMMRSLRENDGDTTHVHGRNQEDSDDELGGPGGVTVESVDSGDGSLQDRADHLIQHIVRLQNRNPRDILLPAAPIPSPVGPPRTEAPSSTRFTALEKLTVDHFTLPLLLLTPCLIICK
ncbi:hypothetical protein FB451DRAFT_1235966 [Mycena latifolia]|nr:hypothetical protein FB451DRAFT_1235966 [Mycena latifolia]